MNVDRAINAQTLPTGEAIEVEIELEIPPASNIEELADGGVIITLGAEPSDDPDPEEFDANLALLLEDSELTLLAGELLEAFEGDLRSRSDWERSYMDGLKLLGLKIERRTMPWQDACGVFHPVLTEAAVRFQSQAIMEIFPAEGPVKTQIVGRITPERERQAQRVRDDMNYLTTEVMSEYRPETERLLWSLSLAGAAYRKVYWDPLLERPVAVFIDAKDFVVNYGCSDLQSASRVAQIMKKPSNDIRKLMAGGFYRTIDLPEPAPEYRDIDETVDDLEGVAPTVEYDDRHTLIEFCVDLDLAGFEDVGPDGEPTGIALPYVVTVEKSSSIVLAIRRNWEEDDPRKVRGVHFIDYGYVPGPGFYPFGLIHLIGGLADSATSILRQLVDAGTLSNLPAGLKSRGLRIKGDDSPIMPGEFRDVDVPGGAIRDNITFLPYKEPSAVLYQLLGSIVEEARRAGSIADLDVGDMNAQAPVGTTLALMERALKIMSAVQARLHNSLRREFKLLAKIVRDHMPGKYDYEVEDGATRSGDYSDAVDVIPVSDPNAATMSQRVVQYQAALTLASQQPGLYDMAALHRQMLTVLGIRDVNSILPNKEVLKPVDPVTENMNILTGKPVRAFVAQDHQAHLTVHQSAMKDPMLLQMVGQSPNAMTIQAAAMAHMNEHLAFSYRQQLEEQMGVPLPLPGEQLPPEVEADMAKVLAEAAERLLQANTAKAEQAKAAETAKDPVVQLQEREIAVKEADLQRRSATDAGNLAIKGAKLQSDEKIAMARIQAETQTAGARMGMDAARSKAEIASREGIDGARIGVDIARASGKTGLRK